MKREISIAHRRAEGLREIWSPTFIQMFLVATIIAFATQFQATTFPIYVQSLGGGLTAAGLMTSVYMGISALCKPFVGRLLYNCPRKRLFILTGLCFTSIIALFGYIPYIPLLILIRGINAPFYSVCNTAATTMTTDILPDRRLVEGLGYYNLAQTLSYALGPSFALFLIQRYSYKTLFFVCSLFALTAILIGTTVKYDDPVLKREITKKEDEEKHAEPSGGIGKILHGAGKEMIMPALMLYIIFLGTSGIVTYLPTWASAAGVENIGLFFTVQAVALAISRLFVGKVTKKLGASKVIVGSILLISTCLLGISLCCSIMPLLILSTLYGFGFGAIVPTLHTVTILTVSKENRGMANSIIQMATDAGICTCSLLLGFIADAVGIKNVFYFAGAFPLLALIFYFAKLRKQIVKVQIC